MSLGFRIELSHNTPSELNETLAQEFASIQFYWDKTIQAIVEKDYDYALTMLQREGNRYTQFAEALRRLNESK